MRPVYRTLSWVNPNVLTLISIIPSVLFLVFLNTNHPLLAALALVGNILDMFDGGIARANGKVSKFGGVLDSVSDRISDFIIIWSFGIVGAGWTVVGSVLLFSFLTSYIRSRTELAAGGSTSLAIGLIERPERIIFVGILALLYAAFNSVDTLRYGLMVLAVLSAITFFQRFYASYKVLR